MLLPVPLRQMLLPVPLRAHPVYGGRRTTRPRGWRVGPSQLNGKGWESSPSQDRSSLNTRSFS